MPRKHSTGEADPIDVQVGAMVRFLRQKKDMSQQTLADIAGVTFQQIQKYERGSNRISASRLSRIAKALDVSVADFFGENASEDASPHLYLLSTPNAIEMLELFSAANPKVRKALLGFMRASLSSSDEITPSS